MIGFMFFVLTIFVVGLGILGVAAGLRRISEPSRPELPPADLERLESALSAMEARLDDLQDQQRFLERLLEARPETGALGPGADEEAGGDEPDGGSILFDTEPEEEH